jgi:hypothetical protein
MLPAMHLSMELSARFTRMMMVVVLVMVIMVSFPSKNRSKPFSP